MIKKILIVFLILCLIIVAYVICGWLGIVPLYHCDTAMGPNGPVSWCEWYSGPARIY